MSNVVVIDAARYDTKRREWLWKEVERWERHLAFATHMTHAETQAFCVDGVGNAQLIINITEQLKGARANLRRFDTALELAMRVD